MSLDPSKVVARLLMATGMLCCVLERSQAQKSWNSPTSGNWNVAGNWTPPGVPGGADDVTIGNVVGTEGTRVTLDVNAFANTITLQSGNDLDTADFELTADSMALSGSGTTLLVKPNNSGTLDSVDMDFMDVNSGALLQMLGGRVEIDGNTGDGRLDLLGTLTGYGFIDLEAPVAGSRFTINGGTLNVGNTSDGIGLLSDVARTLLVNATDLGATVDFDNGASPTVNLLASGTLDLNVPMNDPYGGTMNLSRKSTLDIEDAWDFQGTMNVNTQAGIFAGQSAGPATLHGGGITMSGGTINLDNAADHLIVDLGGSFTTTAGTINFALGTLQFDSSATIGAGTDFVNGDATELILNATLTVNDDDWDWDGSGGADQIITINDLGQLNANITNPLADDAWSGTMNINGGNLNVQASNDNWSSTATINIGGTTLSRILGDEFHQDSGTTTVAIGADLDVTSANVWTAGSFVVNGHAELNGATTWAGSSVSGTGTLQQDSDATVTANTTIGVTTYDLDGNTGANTDITINPGVTFTVNSTAIDTSGGFNGNLHVNSGTLDVNTANWSIDSGGDLNLTNTGSGGATLDAGGVLTVNSGGNVTAVGSSNALNTDVVFQEGSNLHVNSGGSLSIGNLGHTTTLAGGDIIQDVGGATVTNNGTLSVTGASTISVTTFDWDQGPTIIESTGNLIINVTNIDAAAPVNQYDNTLTINGGTLSVNNAANVWLMDATTNFNGGGTISGDAVRFGDDLNSSDSNLNVTGAGVAVISATSAFLSDADVFIGAGATLRTTGATTFEPVNGVNNGEFTGTGTWQLGGTNNFNEVTTINMVGGSVDLDNSFLALPLFANDTNINANLTINAATMANYGNSGFFGAANFSDMNIADAATLTVNLDSASSEWNVVPVGIINYNGNASANTFLAGSNINLNGTLNVTGDGRTDAQMDIGGTVNILTAAEAFRLSGGNLTTNTNRLTGGTINGPGALAADAGTPCMVLALSTRTCSLPVRPISMQTMAL